MDIIIISTKKGKNNIYGRKRRNTFISIAFSDTKMEKVLFGNKYCDVWNSTLKNMALIEIKGLKEPDNNLKDIEIKEIKRGIARNDIYTEIINTIIKNTPEETKFIKIWPKICEKIEIIKKIATRI